MKLKIALFCIGLLAVLCGCESNKDEKEVSAVVKEVSSWVEPYLTNGGLVQEDDHGTIYFRGRVGELASVFNVIDIVMEVSPEKRSVSFFGLLPTLAPEDRYEDMAELISRGEMSQGLSSAWLVLDDFGHVRCQSWASFDSILHNAEETRVTLVGAVLDKLLSFACAVAAIELGHTPEDAMSGIGRVEMFQKTFGGHHFGKEDDVEYILERCYQSASEAAPENKDPWWDILSFNRDGSEASFIHAQMEEVIKDIGGRYDILPYTLIVRDGMVWSVCVMPDICPEEKRGEVVLELMKINFGLSTTLLHMDFDTGRIWSCYQLPVSAIRDNENPIMRDLYEAQMQVAAVLAIAVHSEKIYAAFSSKKEN